MRHIRPIRYALLLITLAAASSVQVFAQNTDWRTNRQARTVVNRLITNTNSFRTEIQRNRYPWDTANTNVDDRLSNQATALYNALTSLRTSLNSNADTTDELNGVLSRASRINMLLDRNQVNSRAQTRWSSIRTDVNTLAGYYNVAWNWNEPYNPNGGNGGYGNNGGNGGYGNNGGNGGYGNGRALTGTYRLNTTMSDNVTSVVDRNVGNYSADQRDRMRQNLQRRLSSPDMIAIDKNGQTIMLASSLRPQVTFEADGIAHTETNDRGRTTTTTVTQTADSFTVKTTGDRGRDFTVTFETDRNGHLRVTRQLYLENRNETVSSTAVYDKIDQTANWSSITMQTDPYTPSTGNTNAFYIPNGTTLTATLRNSVNTRASQSGDRFTMDVVSPNEFRGSVIEGHVADLGNSGRVSGRARLQLDFDTITVNGQQYAFAGMINSVSSINGDSVTVNNEGTIRDDNRTNQTVTRAGIGAVLGAVIGAIAGGGQGAAIGAGIGAGAGAGSILVGGRDSIELASGSTFNITASAPLNAAYIRRN